MRKLFTLLFVIANQFNAFAHEGELLKITDVKIKAPCEHIYFQFQIENVDEILLKDVRIELMAGDVTLAEKNYERFPVDRYTQEAFVVTGGHLRGVDPREIKINVTRIFDIPKDWGGWHGVDPALLNYNDVGDYEIYADAPYRMTIYDSNDDPLPVPIHMLCHDGNDILDQQRKPFLEYIDIYVKKSSVANFGDAVDLSGLSPSELDALFTARSIGDLDVGIQSFDLSLPVTDGEHTLAFRELYNSNRDYHYTNLKNAWWYFTLNLPVSELEGFSDDDDLDIHVKFNLRNNSGNPYVRESFLRVFRNTEAVPSIAGYHRGDTHVHTMFSQSIIEFGGPLAATKEAARAVGIDWIIATDHTSDFDNWKDQSIQGAWDRLGVEVERLNTEDPSIPFIRGQEVSLLNAQRQLVHFLAYPGYETPMNLPYLGDGGGDIQLTNTTATQTLNRLEEIDGFAYAAHPFANQDELPVVGGLWNVGDPDFPHNGLPWQSQGLILCNAVSQPSDVFSSNSGEVVQNRLKGAQIWGVRSSLGNETDPYDPYAIGENNDKQFEAVPEDESNYLVRYRQGEEVVNFVNQKALRLKNADLDLENFKFFFSAGTDAHASFNYSNTSGFGLWLTDEDVTVTNYAFGNINCVAYTPEGPGAEGEHALKAMHDGAFSLSDGPILVLGVSSDGNNPQNELLMGGDLAIEETDIENMYYNFLLASSSEFGSFDYLRIFIGTEEGETAFTIEDLNDFNDAVSLSLNELFNQAGISIPMDQYFYVRAEAQTYVEYGENSPHIIEGENFHSFTNPVWVRVNSMVTGISDGVKLSLMIYPNPFSNSTVLRFHQPPSFNYDLNLYDVKGRLVRTYKNLNETQVTIERGDLLPGKYLLNLSPSKSEDVMATFKLVIY